MSSHVTYFSQTINQHCEYRRSCKTWTWASAGFCGWTGVCAGCILTHCSSHHSWKCPICLYQQNKDGFFQEVAFHQCTWLNSNDSSIWHCAVTPAAGCIMYNQFSSTLSLIMQTGGFGNVRCAAYMSTSVWQWRRDTDHGAGDSQWAQIHKWRRMRETDVCMIRLKERPRVCGDIAGADQDGRCCTSFPQHESYTSCACCSLMYENTWGTFSQCTVLADREDIW